MSAHESWVDLLRSIPAERQTTEEGSEGAAEGESTDGIKSPTSVGFSTSVGSATSAEQTDSSAGLAGDGFHELGREEIEAFDARQEFADSVAHLVGLPPADGTAAELHFGDVRLTVTRRLDERGYFVYDVISGAPRRLKHPLCLAQLYAFALAGDLPPLSGPKQGLVKSMLLVDLEFVDPPTRAIPIVGSAPAAAHTTVAVLERHLRYRRVRRPANEPFPFSAPMIARYYRVPTPQIVSGKRWLQDAGVLTKAGSIPSATPARRPTNLWIVNAEPIVVEGDLLQLDGRGRWLP